MGSDRWPRLTQAEKGPLPYIECGDRMPSTVALTLADALEASRAECEGLRRVSIAIYRATDGYDCSDELFNARYELDKVLHGDPDAVPETENAPIGKCARCGAPAYMAEGYCGVCGDRRPIKHDRA